MSAHFFFISVYSTNISLGCYGDSVKNTWVYFDQNELLGAQFVELRFLLIVSTPAALYDLGF